MKALHRKVKRNLQVPAQYEPALLRARRGPCTRARSDRSIVVAYRVICADRGVQPVTRQRGEKPDYQADSTAGTVNSLQLPHLTVVKAFQISHTYRRMIYSRREGDEEMLALKDKVAIVTGGNSGIGKAIVLEFAKQDAKIAIDYLCHPDATEELEQQVAALGDQVTAVDADVSKSLISSVSSPPR